MVQDKAVGKRREGGGGAKKRTQEEEKIVVMTAKKEKWGNTEAREKRRRRRKIWKLREGSDFETQGKVFRGTRDSITAKLNRGKMSEKCQMDKMRNVSAG